MLDLSKDFCGIYFDWLSTSKSLRKSWFKSRIKGFRTILGEAASGLESGLKSRVNLGLKFYNMIEQEYIAKRDRLFKSIANLSSDLCEIYHRFKHDSAP